MTDCKLRAKNCGGCPLLGLDYAAQLKQKEEKVRTLVGKYGPVRPIRGMQQPWHYRNKAIATFAPAPGGKVTTGIYAAGTHKVLPAEDCLLQDAVLNKTLLAVRQAANACRYAPFNEDKGTGPPHQTMAQQTRALILIERGIPAGICCLTHGQQGLIQHCIL